MFSNLNAVCSDVGFKYKLPYTHQSRGGSLFILLLNMEVGPLTILIVYSEIGPDSRPNTI
jgi:hypothetical protein